MQDAKRAVVTETERIQKEKDDEAMEYRQKLQREQSQEIERKLKAIKDKDIEERRIQEEARKEKAKLDAEYHKVR